MKKLIAVGVNEFTYQPIKSKKVAVRDDIREFTAKHNLIRLKAGKSTFLTNSLTIQ